MTRFLAILLNDFKNIRRDPFLMFIAIYPWILGFLCRFLIPKITLWLEGHIDATLYYPLVVSLLAIITPLLLGMVSGLILLEEKEQNTLAAVAVSPLPIGTFLAFRLAFVTILSFAAVEVMILSMGVAQVSFWQLQGVSLLAAIMAPISALLISALANNKIEGFVIGKMVGVMTMVPFGLHFLPTKWQWPLAMFPTYWSTEFYFKALEGSSSFPLLILGLSLQSLALLGCLKLFLKRLKMI